VRAQWYPPQEWDAPADIGKAATASSITTSTKSKRERLFVFIQDLSYNWSKTEQSNRVLIELFELFHLLMDNLA